MTEKQLVVKAVKLAGDFHVSELYWHDSRHRGPSARKQNHHAWEMHKPQAWMNAQSVQTLQDAEASSSFRADIESRAKMETLQADGSLDAILAWMERGAKMQTLQSAG